jgi:two-component system sensor histidine kinase PilS (NtrC family)
MQTREKQSQLKRLGWFLPLRLVTFVILFAVVVFWIDYPGFLHLPLILYSVFTLGFTLLLAFDRRHKLRMMSASVIALQFLLEIVIESGIIFTTGSINSPFSALFLLTIVSAALAYRLVGTLVVASLVSLAYTFIIWLHSSEPGEPVFFPDALKNIVSAQDTVFYSIFLHLLIFYLIAFISGYLAERLETRDRQLADTSRALKQAQLETDDILRHLNSGLLTVDAGGRIIFFNPAAERILGYREEEVKGMRCDEVFAERMPDLACDLLDGLRCVASHPRREIAVRTAEQQLIPLGLSTSILTDEGGGLRGVIAIFSDLTDAKRMESKVRAADRLAAVGELSASIAHEIRNPLAAISGSVEVLNNELRLQGENARLMQLIVKESHRLSRILSEFLQYARIDRPAYNKVELCHLINEVLQILHHHSSFRRDIRLDFESDGSIAYVVGDEDLIKQLLLNLAVNALEALEEKGDELTFRLAVDPVGRIVELYVQDNGPGIAAEHKKQVYQPFFSTKKQGTGLGLAIVHRICSAMKVDVSFDSQLDHGTTFRLEFSIYTDDRSDSRVTSAVSQAVVKSSSA